MGVISRAVEQAVRELKGDPAKLREFADHVLARTAHRGIFIRLNAAELARELRRAASNRDDVGSATLSERTK